MASSSASTTWFDKDGETVIARGGSKVFHSENDPRAYIEAIRSLLEIKPDLLIGSLWRSCIVLIIVKLLRRDIKVVTFLHLASDVHWPDKLLNRLAMRLFTEIWADSQTTLDARLPNALRARGRVISFLVERQSEPQFRKPLPRFIFWGDCIHKKIWHVRCASFQIFGRRCRTLHSI